MVRVYIRTGIGLNDILARIFSAEVYEVKYIKNKI
jgi:hypothetical protein